MQIGLEDIANSLQTGSVTDDMGEVENIVGGLLGKLKGALGIGKNSTFFIHLLATLIQMSV